MCPKVCVILGNVKAIRSHVENKIIHHPKMLELVWAEQKWQ